MHPYTDRDINSMTTAQLKVAISKADGASRGLKSKQELKNYLISLMPQQIEAPTTEAEATGVISGPVIEIPMLEYTDEEDHGQEDAATILERCRSDNTLHDVVQLPLQGEQIIQQPQMVWHYFESDHFETLRKIEDEKKQLLQEYVPVVPFDELPIGEESKKKLYYDLKTFCISTARVLHRRLKPNVQKTNWESSRALPLRGCNFKVFDSYFGLQKQLLSRKCKVSTNVEDGLKEPERIFTYEFDGMPDLLQTTIPKWYYRHHGDGFGRYNGVMRSYYTKVLFTIYEFDDRVTCRWVQTTETEVTPGVWTATA